MSNATLATNTTRENLESQNQREQLSYVASLERACRNLEALATNLASAAVAPAYDFTSPRLRTREAAAYLGIKEPTLRAARSSGILLGREPPSFYQLGKIILYERCDLDFWFAQLEPKKTTCE